MVINKLLTGLCSLVFFACQPFPKQEGSHQTDTTRTIRFETREATDAHVDVSPDGKTILFDVLGDLYTLPIDGGEARPFTSGPSWDVQGRYSPDGREVAFISDRGGAVGLWTVQADGTRPIEYAVSHRDWTLNSCWTPGGLLLDLAPDSLAEFKTPRQQQPAFGKNIDPGLYYGSFSSDGGYGYTAGNGLQRIDLVTGERKELVKNAEQFMASNPCISPDNRMLAYMNSTYTQAKGEGCDLRVLDLVTGEDRELVDSISVDIKPRYDFTPDGRSIIVSRRGELVRVDVATGLKANIPFKVSVVREVSIPLHHASRRIGTDSVETKIIRWPTCRGGANRIVYSAFGKLYASEAGSNARPRRLTTDGAFEFSPALSPDGKWVAYTTWADREMGHIMIVPAGGGQPRQVTTSPGRYTNPAWSPDGSWLAFIADTTAARQGLRSRHSGPNIIGWKLILSRASGVQHGKAVVNAGLTITPGIEPGRFYPIPTVSADGGRVFVVTYHNDGEKAGSVLLSAKPDGTDVVYHLWLPPGDEAVVSPDSRHVAVVSQGKLWVVEVPLKPEKDIPAADLTRALLVSNDAPTYVSWQDSETLVWAITDKIYQRRIDTTETAKLLTDVDIREPYLLPNGEFALVNARVVTMKGREVIEQGTIIVRNNRIAEVGKSVAVPNNMFIFDMKGKTIIPGLVEAHCHAHHACKELWQKQNYQYTGNLAYGVTTIYDPSTSTMDVFGQAEMVKTGIILGPRVFSSGAPILGGNPNATSYRDIRSPQDALNAVAQVARYGASPIKEYLQLRRQQRQWLVRAARQCGVLIVSHYGGSRGTDFYEGLTRITDGFTGIEHELRSTPVYDDVIRFVAASKVIYTPMIGGSVGDLYGHRLNVDDAKLNRFNPRFVIEREKAMFTSAGYRLMARQYEVGRKIASRALADISSQGGLLGVSAHGNGIPGLATHWEMWSYTLAGMSPFEALQAATLNGARKLDLQAELGSIEAGKLADLVVLNSNPLENIENSTDVYRVIKDGFVYDGADMTQLWPFEKALEPWPWELDVYNH